jgi:ATP-binding cassette subfamily A (ABC1) protein 3
MYSKTAGDSMINGYDTDKDLATVRKSLGICPQHNMLFPELTVNEHFTMFGMVRNGGKQHKCKIT